MKIFGYNYKRFYILVLAVYAIMSFLYLFFYFGREKIFSVICGILLMLFMLFDYLAKLCKVILAEDSIELRYLIPFRKRKRLRYESIEYYSTYNRLIKLKVNGQNNEILIWKEGIRNYDNMVEELSTKLSKQTTKPSVRDKITNGIKMFVRVVFTLVVIYVILVSSCVGLLHNTYKFRCKEYAEYAEIDEGARKNLHIPPVAKDICYCYNYGMGASSVYEYNIPEDKFLSIAKERGWKVEKIKTEKSIHRSRYKRRMDKENKTGNYGVKIEKGYFYEKRYGNGGGTTIGYDSEIQRLYHWSSHR